MFAASFKVAALTLIATSALAAPTKRDSSGTATYYGKLSIPESEATERLTDT